MLCCCACAICIAAEAKQRYDDNIILIQQLASEIPALKSILDEQEIEVGSDSADLLNRKRSDYDRIYNDYMILKKEQEENVLNKVGRVNAPIN